MTTTTHASFVIERRYDAAPSRVFAAWADPVAKRQWFVEGEGWDIQSYELHFREGGTEKSRFRFARGQELFGEETMMGNETVFNEIVPNERIIFTYSMDRNGRRFSVSLASNTTAAFFIAAGTAGLIAGQLVDRFDPRYTIIGGSVIASLSLLSIGVVTEAWQLFAFYIVFGFSYGLCGLVPTTTLISRWFERRRALAMSIDW